MALVCYCTPNESHRCYLLVSSPPYHISILSHQSPMCFTSVVEAESLISSLALFLLDIKLPQFSVEALVFSLFMCKRGILEEDKKQHINISFLLGKSLEKAYHLRCTISYTTTQVTDSIRYVKHMEVFTTTSPGLWQVSPGQNMGQ